MVKLKLFLGFSLLLNSTILSASIVEIGNINRINGLDWLDLSVTDGLSVDEALSANTGYRIATATEFQDMLALFEITGDTNFIDIDASDATITKDSYRTTFSALGSALGDHSDWFLNAFTEVFEMTRNEITSSFSITESMGLYLGSDSILRIGGVRVWLETDSPYRDTAWVHHDSADANVFQTIGNHGFGSFLVKESAVVPVPSAVWLFGSGLIVLFGIAKRKAWY